MAKACCDFGARAPIQVVGFTGAHRRRRRDFEYDNIFRCSRNWESTLLKGAPASVPILRETIGHGRLGWSAPWLSAFLTSWPDGAPTSPCCIVRRFPRCAHLKDLRAGLAYSMSMIPSTCFAMGGLRNISLSSLTWSLLGTIGWRKYGADGMQMSRFFRLRSIQLRIA